ncbi:MAG: response regulator [Gammaproteobacteria bacterium]|nr:response regulator [Gammaproteobacteria bacterium]MDH5653881.1 response regulator [Gammaproteobacteria bacterium]
MTDKPSQSAEERIRALKRSYFEQLPERVTKLKSIWSNLYSANWQQPDLETFHREIHSLAGSGETFGFRILSQKARQLEKFFTDSLGKLPPKPEIIDQLQALLNSLEETICNLSPDTESITELLPLTINIQRQDKTDKCNEIIILLNDQLQAEGLAALFGTRNLNGRIFADADSACRYISETLPQAFIIEVSNNHQQGGTIQIIQTIHQRYPDLPILVVSEHDDIATRLAVLRAGTNHFFPTPLNTKLLFDTLHRLATPRAQTPYRVLIIDDDEPLAQFYAETMRMGNIIADIVSQPEQSIDKIQSTLPELILLDIHMEGINGIELAGLIRQYPQFETIPIIFLSTETNIRFQLSAIDQVGDFIKKPVWPEYLVTTVTSKCRHARKLRETRQSLENTLREYESQKLAMDQHSIVSIADKHGNITYVNHRFCDISGYSEAELIGMNHRIIKSNEHDNDFYTAMWQTISSGNVWHGEIKNRKRNGDCYWVESTIVPFLDESGQPYQYISVRTDISEIKENEIAQKNAQRRLSEQNTALVILTNNEKLLERDRKSALEILTEVTTETLHIDRTSIWLFSPEKDFLTCETLYDVKNCKHLIPEEPIWADSLPEHIDNVINERIYVLDDSTASRHGIQKPDPYYDQQGVMAVMSAAIYANGQCIGMICFEHLSSKRKWWPEDTNFATTIADYVSLLFEQWERMHIQQALRESEFRLKQSQEFANIGTIDLEIPTMQLYWSKLVAPLLGYEPGTRASYDRFINAVDPRDRDNLIADITECIEDGDEFNREFRVIWPDDSIRWISGSGNITYSEDHTPLHMLGVLRDITSQKKVQDALILAKENAEQANKAKSEFLSRMSHELRTPMNAILGFAQLLEVGEDKMSEAQLDSVNEILKAGRHLLELINEVLDLSRIEAGKLELHCEQIHFHSLLDECIKLVLPLAREKNIRINNNPDEKQHIHVFADRTRLKQVIVNLLGNAIKYNKPRGSISIDISTEHDRLARISISDTGLGIPKDQQPYIFQAFERAGSDNSGIEGTGIGLVITKHLVELMGGSIGFTSNPEHGSTFWIELPLEQEVADIHIHQKVIRSVKHDANIVFPDQFNILYVEDNPANLKLVNNILGKRKQIALTTATTGEDGLKLALATLPNLILMDINLPGMDGFETFSQIKSYEKLKNTPIIAITAQAMPHDIERYIKHGFNEYLAKPLDLNQLLEVIDGYMSAENHKKNRA